MAYVNERPLAFDTNTNSDDIQNSSIRGKLATFSCTKFMG